MRFFIDHGWKVRGNLRNVHKMQYYPTLHFCNCSGYYSSCLRTGISKLNSKKFLRLSVMKFTPQSFSENCLTFL